MPLQGTLETMAVEDLLGWMAERKHSGTLALKRGAVTKTLNIEAGRVVNAGSTDPREYFGQFLINFGLITEDQFQKAFETQKETRVLLGKILVMTGLLSEDQVHKMLALKIRETVLDVYIWDSGAFEFQDGLLQDDPSTIHVEVMLSQLNLEGKQRRERIQEIRTVIPDNRCTFQARVEPAAGQLDPKSSTGVMFDLARQGYSASDIILRFHSVDYPILNALCELVQKGWLAVKAPGPVSQEALPVIEVDLTDAVADQGQEPDAYLLEAQGAMQRRDFDQATVSLRKGLSEHPYDPDLTEALEMAERGLVEQLRSELLDQTKIPALARQDMVLTSDDWTPAQRYLLSRIDGRRSLRSIIIVSPLKEVDALRTFKALLDSGSVLMK